MEAIAKDGYPPGFQMLSQAIVTGLQLCHAQFKQLPRLCSFDLTG
jgi:hypothetical protein